MGQPLHSDRPPMVTAEVAAATAVVAENLNVALGCVDSARPALELLDRRLTTSSEQVAPFVAEQLLPLVGQRHTAVANLVFELFERHIARFPRPLNVLAGLLAARSEELQRRAAQLAPLLASLGCTRMDPDGVDEVVASCADSPAVIGHAPSVVALGHLLDGPDGPAGDLATGSPARRRLAARALDAVGLPDHDLVRRILGSAPADALRPYLDFTRATHLDLVVLTPVGSGMVPCLDSLLRSSRVLSQGDLAQLIGDLGWARVCWGISVRRVAGISIAGGLPYRIDHEMAHLLEDEADARRRWDRLVVVAEGDSGTGGSPPRSTEVLRFRRCNITHAELLEAILEIAPLTRRKAEFILQRMDSVVDDFECLFGSYTADGLAAREKYQSLRERIESGLHGDTNSPQSSATARLVQMFEEPRSVDEVTTLHGLKRYLHQRSLRLAFRLFGTATANRTVDIVVLEAERVQRVVQVLRYVDFEPEHGRPNPPPPLAVSLVVDALAAHLLHGGSARLPSIEMLAYGNEVQIYLHYLNHPAFLRLDLSSPRDGGMLDLEYFAASQTELENHPDLEFAATRRLLTNLDFDVERDSLRLRVRYDKERALDLEDLIEHVRHLLSIVPYLMDFDWVVAGLEYPTSARKEVVDAWARYIAGHAVLPVDLLLTQDRHHIWRAEESTPAGVREIPWDGVTPYADRYAHGEGKRLANRLERALAGRGVDHLAAWGEARGRLKGQRLLERVVLDPFRDAIARGELLAGANALTTAESTLFQREHEATRLARTLAVGGPALIRAVGVAHVVNRVQRVCHFHPTGTVQGRPVERSMLRHGQRRVGLFVLRDDGGTIRLAMAVEGGVLYQHRNHPSDPWQPNSELEPEVVSGWWLEKGTEQSIRPSVDIEAIQRSLVAPRADTVPDRVLGERIWPAVVAAPGRAGGFARFMNPRMTAKDAAEAVLVAPAFRPDHAPLIARAAALLSTGGGILSHAGVTALELGIPALAVEALWSHRPTARLVRQQVRYSDEQLEINDLSVTVRREVGETFDTIEEGDLVVVDAYTGALSVLGQDPDALAVFREMGTLESAAKAIDQAGRSPDLLAARGWMLRCAHHLDKLLSRLTRTSVARYAASTLALGRAAGDTGGGGPDAALAERSRLLSTLLANPACGEVARSELARIDEAMRIQLEQLTRDALDTLRSATNVFQIVYPWLSVLRIQRALEQLAHLLDAPALTGTDASDRSGTAFRLRLQKLQRELLDDLNRDLQGGQAWRIRHSLHALEQTASVIGESCAADGVVGRARQALATAEATQLASTELRLYVSDASGGLELAPLIGTKAAHLGEIARILGPGGVPRWAAVTNEALQRTLGQSIARAGTLGAAIREVMARPQITPGDKADHILRLWSQVPLPDSVHAAIIEAYRWICADEADTPVAVRSSAFEEDSERQPWAGQFVTFLGVHGEDSVVEHVRRTWAALWSRSVLVRRQQLGLGPQVQAASGVVLQRMVEARSSGVLFTASPAARAGQMVLNVGLGLGEGVVSGVAEVDLVVIERPRGPECSLELDYKVADKRHRVVLTAKMQGTRVAPVPYHQRLRPALEFIEIQQLVAAALALEQVLRHPLDIEFALEGAQLRILQARPVPVFHASLSSPLLIQAAHRLSDIGEPS